LDLDLDEIFVIVAQIFRKTTPCIIASGLVLANKFIERVFIAEKQFAETEKPFFNACTFFVDYCHLFQKIFGITQQSVRTYSLVYKVIESYCLFHCDGFFFVIIDIIVNRG
jgi:hypothetical protein